MISGVTFPNESNSLFSNGFTDRNADVHFERHFRFRTELGFYIIDLRVPFEENMDCAHQRKLEKYENLPEQWVKNEWTTDIFPRFYDKFNFFISN